MSPQLWLVIQHIQTAIDQESQRALDAKWIETRIDGDFGVGDGLSYKAQDDHQLRDMDQRIQERLEALSWILNQSANAHGHGNKTQT